MNIEPPTLLEWGAIAISPLLASFASTASIRAARAEQWVSGRSHCDTCATQLPAIDLIPIVSAILRRGRCRFCAAPIPTAHILAEYALPLAALLAACAMNGAAFASLYALALLLLAAAIYDVQSLRIPDAFTASIALGGAAFAFAFFRDEAWPRVLAAAGFGAILLAAALAHERLRKRPGLGGGDVKLFAAGALWLPPWAAPWALASAALSALAWTWLQQRGTAGVSPAKESEAGVASIRAHDEFQAGRSGFFRRRDAGGPASEPRLIPFAPFLALGIFSCLALALTI
jgi:leader peptidase (prepilin peptidase)/N-methyltransferase